MNITNRFANACYLDLYTLYQQMIITHSEIQATATKGRFFFTSSVIIYSRVLIAFLENCLRMKGLTSETTGQSNSSEGTFQL